MTDPSPTRPPLPWDLSLVLLMAGLMLTLFVAAMDSTVVGTALPTIAHQIGNPELYPWVFSGYLLTSTTTVPLWGRLADGFGRRRVLLTGLAIFVVASVLCGLAPSMPALIIFRTLQGIGAGCVQPIVFTVVGDTFPTSQRARLQGFFSAVWAVAAVIGPVLGATFVTTIGWRWIFGINLPIGIVAALLLLRYREQRPETMDRSIEVRGALTLTAGVALLLWGLGTGSASGKPVWQVAAAGVALLAVFVLLERRSKSPTVPLDLLRHRVMGPAIASSLLAGMIMFCVSAYVPLSVQNGLGQSAYIAGATVAPMSLTWPLGSVLSGFLLLRVGFQPLAVAGSLGLVIGCALLGLVTSTTAVVAIGSAAIGFGMGLLSTPILIVIQSSVPWSKRGAATALNQFSRTIGGAVGVSLLGVLLETQAGTGATGSRLLGGIRFVFLACLGVALATFALTLAMLLGRKRGASGVDDPAPGASS